MDYNRIEYMKNIFAISLFLSRKWELIVNRAYSNDDLTIKQLMLMMVIVGAFDEDPTIKQISTAMTTSHQNVKALLTQLENKGFVNIYQDTNDKRVSRVRMNKEKQDYWVERDRKDLEILITLFEGISTENLQSMEDMLMKLDKIASEKLSSD